MKPVLVLEAEKPAAYALLKSIVRNGYQAVAASHNRICAGAVSRYALRFIKSPNINSSYNAYADWLHNELQVTPYITIMSFSDKTTQLLSEHKDRFSAYTCIYQPNREALENVLNKRKTRQLAEQLNIPVPRVYDPQHEDDIQFPVVLKPVHKVTWHKGRAVYHKVGRHNYVWNKAEYITKRQRMLKQHVDFDVQEYIEGVGRGYFAIAYNGIPAIDYAHERIREYPVTGGASCCRRIINCDKLKKLSLPLLHALEWNGPIMCEYRYNPVTKRYYLLEINGRWWGSLPLALHAGIEMPTMMLDAITGTQRIYSDSYRIGFTSRLLIPHDAMWCIAMILRGKWREALSIFNRTDAEDIWDSDDIWAFFANCVSALTNNLFR